MGRPLIELGWLIPLAMGSLRVGDFRFEKGEGWKSSLGPKPARWRLEPGRSLVEEPAAG